MDLHSHWQSQMHAIRMGGRPVSTVCLFGTMHLAASFERRSTQRTLFLRMQKASVRGAMRFLPVGRRNDRRGGGQRVRQQEAAMHRYGEQSTASSGTNIGHRPIIVTRAWLRLFSSKILSKQKRKQCASSIKAKEFFSHFLVICLVSRIGSCCPHSRLSTSRVPAALVLGAGHQGRPERATAA